MVFLFLLFLYVLLMILIEKQGELRFLKGSEFFSLKPKQKRKARQVFEFIIKIN